MFFYHCLSETKSQVLVIELIDDYRVSYHYSEQEGKEVESFYQSRELTRTEMNQVIISITKQATSHQVPDFIITQFVEKINESV